MNKAEFVKAVAEKAELTQKDADTFLKAYVDVVTTELKAGGKISLPGFCSYEIKNRAAKTGINPATKKKIKIPAAKVPACKLGKAYKDLF